MRWNFQGLSTLSRHSSIPSSVLFRCVLISHGGHAVRISLHSPTSFCVVALSARQAPTTSTNWG